jgi:hypothetical protein
VFKDSDPICDAYRKDIGRFSIACTLALTEEDVSSLNENTPIHIQVGGTEFNATLGTNYAPGVTRARFQVYAPGYWLCETVELSWNSRRAVMEVSGRSWVNRPGYDEPLLGVDPIVADEFKEQPSGSVAVSIPAVVTFGAATATFDIPGQVRIRTSKRSIWLGFETNFVSSIVTLRGHATAIAP